jgi:hypothetical protein
VLAPEQTAYLAFTVIGIIVGIGMLLVRPAPQEPEKLDRLFPLARFLAYAPVRIAFACAGFAFALVGLAFAFGWL